MLDMFKNDENEKFVVLPLSDFLKLESIRKIKTSSLYGVSVKMIKVELINFLNAVLVLLKTKEVIEYSIIDDTVRLHLVTTDGIIKSCFSTVICELYYGRPLKFIEEVL